MRFLKLDTLELRRLRIDLHELYKIAHNLNDLRFDDFFQLNRNVTRGHDYKLILPPFRLNIRKFSFAVRVAEVWNSLPRPTVSCASLSLFRSRLEESDLSAFLKLNEFTL